MSIHSYGSIALRFAEGAVSVLLWQLQELRFESAPKQTTNHCLKRADVPNEKFRIKRHFTSLPDCANAASRSHLAVFTKTRTTFVPPIADRGGTYLSCLH